MKKLEELEYELIVETLKSCDDDVTLAAKSLEVTRVVLLKKMKKYALEITPKKRKWGVSETVAYLKEKGVTSAGQWRMEHGSSYAHASICGDVAEIIEKAELSKAPAGRPKK